VVVVLSDANLATAQTLFPRPEFDPAWVAPPIDLRPVPAGTMPYDWDEHTGTSERIIPGRPGGMHTVTGLAHDRASHVAYDPEINAESLRARSHKLATFQQSLVPPVVHGGDEGDLLVMGWGSTKGTIEEAVDRLREEGLRVSSLHLTFLQPMEPGLDRIMARFDRVMAIEANYSDQPGDAVITPDNRRYSALALLLRARYLVDVDCWSQVRGEPIKPSAICRVLRDRLEGVR
jgi:2-oxoglutarate ferredoxin oxidoreductase subunit alpha